MDKDICTCDNNCVCFKETPRSEESKKSLDNRINRIIGQLGGIKKMIAEDRYCGDILTQLSAAESALENLGYVILQEHMETCVSEKIRRNDGEIISETMRLIKNLR
ncbi:MAG: metal-sensing transcriptional repressor [Clostridia bacterium]|nr:metal-sensing transcriptional repressor [Clostridia bacterium]